MSARGRSPTGPPEGDNRTPGPVSEQTPLLAESRDRASGSRPAPIHGRSRISTGGGRGEGYVADLEEGFLDPEDADMYLARSSSPIPSSGLAPEVLESAMLRTRSRSGGSRDRSRRPSWAHENGGQRPYLGSGIAEEDEGDSGSESGYDGVSKTPRSWNRYSENNNVENGERGGNHCNTEATADPGERGDPGKPPHHHSHRQHQQEPREYMIDTDKRRFWLIFSGILATYFLSCFDGTVMASSHPVITSHFRSSNSASWLSTAFLLTSTAFQPVVGRLSDSLGRKPPYLFTMTVFALATVWCATAQSMASFIAARALCGFGAGGMMAVGTIIISDLVPIERRGAYQSYVNIMYGLGAASGAALGGVMADGLGWRWEFGIQVPPILLTLAITSWIIPRDLGIHGKRETLAEAARAFDFGGCLLLTTSITFLILGLNLGGNVIPWSHPFTIASLVISGVCFPACLYVESRVARPVMPLELLHSSPRANIIFGNVIASFLLNAILFNVPLFFQAVLLTSATTSGLYLVVPTVVSSVMGTLTGFLVTWTRRLKWPLGWGAALYLAGTAVLCGMRRGWPVWAYLLCLAPSSLGQGMQFPGTFLAVLAASRQREQAVVTTTLVLWRALGSVLGVASSSLVLQNALRRYLESYVVADGGHRDAAWKAALIERVRGSVEAVAKIADPDVREQVIRSYESAVRVTFVCCTAVALVGCLLIAPIRLPRLGERKSS